MDAKKRERYPSVSSVSARVDLNFRNARRVHRVDERRTVDEFLQVGDACSRLRHGAFTDRSDLRSRVDDRLKLRNAPARFRTLNNAVVTLVTQKFVEF
jgi:hypothetical protein